MQCGTELLTSPKSPVGQFSDKTGNLLTPWIRQTPIIHSLSPFQKNKDWAFVSTRYYNAKENYRDTSFLSETVFFQSSVVKSCLP